MRAIDEVLSDLRRRDIRLWVEGESLRYSAPKGQLTAGVRDQLLQRKAELLDALRRSPAQIAGAAEITRAPRDATPKASFAQQRLWFLSQLQSDGEPSSYHMVFALRLLGELDIAGLEWSLTEVVRRHEVLRTTFCEQGGVAVQVVGEAEACRLEVEELSEEDVPGWMMREWGTAFDLVKGPLWRVRLGRLGEREHVLLVTMHHMVSDAWSQGLWVGEVVGGYQSYVGGERVSRGELGLQYADYAYWQREHLKGELLSEQVDYWRKRLEGAPSALELGTDRPRPVQQTFSGASYGFEVGAEQTSRLLELGAKHGSTLYMVLLSSFQVLLWRYSGQEEIVVGSPVANRPTRQTEELIGLFVNMVPMRSRVEARASFTELLGQVRSSTLDAYAHQDLPFEKLVEELNPERDMSRSPVFQVMFALQNTPSRKVALPGLEVELLETPTQASKFELSLFVEQESGRLRATFEYNTDLFERRTIERMAGHWRSLLERVVSEPGERIGRLARMSEEERSLVLGSWNRTESPYDREVRIEELIRAQSERTPDAVALVSDGQELTYRELESRSNRLASYLRKRGVCAEAKVGVSLERSSWMVVSMLGVWKAGGGYVPIAPSLPEHRRQKLARDAKLRWVISERSSPGVWPDEVEVLGLEQELGALERESDERLVGAGGSRAVAYVMYTSGSTGEPKGVVVEHRSVVNFFRGMDERLGTAPGVWLALTSLSFDISILELVWTLTRGYRVVIQREARNLLQRASEPRDESIGAQIQRYAVTHLQCTPSMAVALLSDERSRRALGQVKKLMLGGEALARGLLGEVQEVSEAEILNMYGPTETTIWSTTSSVRGKERIGIGRPIANTRTYILDGELSPVPWGVVGELYIGGDGLARGYWERPELTAERFVPDPFEGEGGRLYRTGDRARYLEDGTLEYVGRSDTQVKLHGYRIELGEVESSLLAEKEVSQAVAVVREDVAGDRRLVAYWVPKAPNGQALEEQLLSRLRERLPEYMIPSALVEMSSLPLTSNGKVDRKGLPAPSRAPGPARLVGPRNPREYKIAQILSELLGVREIGVHDSFFRLGGHSLLATRAVGRIGESFGVRVSLRSIFEKPTIAGLAEAVEAASADGARASRIERAAQNGPSPLSFAQQRLWVLDQLDPGQSIYNVPMAIELRGELDVPALERSLGHIVKRHEVLRGRVEQEGSEPVQWVDPVGPNELPIIDLSGLGERELEEELVRVVEEEAAAPFDLRRGPLFRVRLVKCASERHVLLGTMHHLVSDGWSRGLLVEELVALYEAYVEGREPTLPELPIQYGDYASWQRTWLTGEVLQDQLAYWTKHLAGAPPALELPPDRSRPQLQSFAGAMKTFELREGLVRALEQVGKQYGATFYMTLLAAFKVLLHRFTGQTDLVVGTPIANRHRPEVEPLIGFFANTLALRTTLDPKLPFHDLLARVRETAVGAYAHQDLPFERLVEELKPARDLGRSPIFQVMFVLQNAPMPPLRLHALEVEPVRARVTTSKFDLTLIVEPREGAMTASFEYSTALYDAATIDQLAAHFTRLLADIADHPETPVADLRLFGEEQKRLLSIWNDTRVDYPGPLYVHQLFEAQAAKTPDATAVIFDRETLTYRELNRRANQLAHLLIARGVEPEALVGICLQRSLHLVVAILAVLKAGAAYVPIDPLAPHQRIKFTLENAGIDTILTEGRLADGGTERCIVLDLDRLGEQMATCSDASPSRPTEGANPAYVMYTSGSTGEPKGVLVTHEALRNHMLWFVDAFAIDGNDVVLQKTAYTFDASVWEFYAPLLRGGALAILRPDDHQDPEKLCRAIKSERVTVLQVVPTMLSALVDHGIQDCESLSRVFSGGEQLSRALRDSFVQQCRAKLYNLYGPTEACIDATWSECDVESSAVMPIGHPIANMQAHVLDENLAHVPIGGIGELYLGGIGLAREYVGRADWTAERFVPNPFGTDGSRLYQTGDRVRRRHDGTLEYLGRIDGQVKIRGFRVELGDVEAALRKCAGVKDAAVVAAPGGEGRSRLVAYFSPKDTPARADAGTLRGELPTWLPEHMIPAAFVRMGELPRTTSGKLDRSKLPPVAEADFIQRPFVAPRNDIERALAQVWKDVLRIGRVSIEDDFVGLGGDSIMSIQVSARAKAAGVLVSPRDVLRRGSLRNLAAAARPAGDVAAGEQGLVTGRVALTPIQRWFFDRNLPSPAHWNMALMFELENPAEPALLAAAVEALLRHHDALRLRFDRDGHDWVQSYATIEECGSAFRHTVVRDADALVSGPATAPLLDDVIDEAQQSFDLARPPLARFVLLEGPWGEAQRLFVTFHHLVVDGVSWRVLLEDLESAYRRLERGIGVQFEPKTASFAQWSREIAHYAPSERLQRELPHWLAQGRSAGSVLPCDRPSGRNTIGCERTVRVEMTKDETAELLREASGASKATVQELLLGAFVATISEWTEADTVPIEIEGHGREDLGAATDTTRTVGWFTSVFPLVFPVARERDTLSILRVVKETMRAVPDHGIGYGILRYVGPDVKARDRLSALLRPEIGFEYMGQHHQGSSGPSMLRLATGGAGSSQDPEADRPYVLSVMAAILDGRLTVTWRYSAEVHDAATVERLGKELVRRLREILGARADGWRCFVPSDFPRARLSAPELARLMQRVAVHADSTKIEDVYPLTFPQRGVLFHSLERKSSGIYRPQVVYTLSTELAPALLERALNEVVKRHTVLRTLFVWEHLDEPLQVVLREAPIDLSVVDWTDLAEADGERRLDGLLSREREALAELTRAPLCRACLVHATATEWKLVVSFHHIILDGWSVASVLSEVLSLYSAGRTNGQAALPPAPKFGEFVEYHLGLDLAAAEAFWKRELAGFRAPTLLGPILGKRHAESGLAVRSAKLSPAKMDALSACARGYRVTLNTLIQGAWALMLARHSGTDDVVFGTVVSGRNADVDGIESLVGMCVNTLPTRVRTTDHLKVRDWLIDLNERALALRDFEQTALTRIHSWSELAPGVPFFDNVVITENYPIDPSLREVSEVTMRSTQTLDDTNYPLALTVVISDVVEFGLKYDRATFSGEAADAVLARFLKILCDDMTRPEAVLADISLVGKEERDLLLAEWRNVDVPYPDAISARDLIEQQVKRTPDAVAVVDDRGSITYAELDARAERLAARLAALGVQCETVVGVMVERSIEMVVALLGIWKAGAAYLPLDPLLPEARRALMLNDSGTKIVVASGGLRARVPPSLRCVSAEDEPAPGAAYERRSLRPANLAYLLYTSGSTGRPKGVSIAHASLVNFLFSMQKELNVRDRDVLLAVTTISFDIAGLELWLPLCSGARVVIATREVASDGSKLAQSIAQHRITMMQATPTSWRLLLEAGWKAGAGFRALCGGEAMPTDLARALLGCGVSLWNLYGPTETTIWSCSERVSGVGASVPLGAPLANTEVFLLDSRMEPVLSGFVGEIFIGGTGLARGYFGQPDATASRFVPSPFGGGAGARLYRTGDLGRRLPDGGIEFVGRLDHQVKIRGHRIELGEVDLVLSELPGVKQAVSVVQRSAMGDDRLVGYWTAAEERGPSPNWRELLAPKLPDYMIPSLFVQVEAFDLTPNGKIDRKKLEARPLDVLLAPQSLAPRDSSELALLKIWEQLLGRSDIGVTDSFFELGGDSLLVARLAGELSRRYGCQLPIGSFLKEPTVEMLATVVRQTSAAQSWSPLVELGSKGSGWPLYLVHSAGGVASVYADLARALGDHRPLFCLEAFGIYGASRPLSTVREMADAYVRAIREKNATGPYYLGGYSMGGVVAFEMATILRGLGADVPLVLLFDTPAPTAQNRKVIEAPEEPVDLCLELLGQEIRDKLPIGREQIRGLPRPKQFELLAESLCRMKVLPPNTTAEELARFVAVYRSNVLAHRDYTSNPQPQPVIVLRSTAAPLDGDPRYGWEQVSTRPVEVKLVPGSHQTMLRPPFVADVGREIEAILQR